MQAPCAADGCAYSADGCADAGDMPEGRTVGGRCRGAEGGGDTEDQQAEESEKDSDDDPERTDGTGLIDLGPVPVIRGLLPLLGHVPSLSEDAHAAERAR